MSPRAVISRAAGALAICAASLAGGGFALASSRATVHTNRGCYLVGQVVHLSGAGFAPSRPYTVSIDGVYFGQSKTDGTGSFSTSLRPGGLASGEVQHADHLEASDGVRTAGATFTLTRRTGGRFLATSGNPDTLRAPFEVWGFAPNGTAAPVYLHYLTPAGDPRATFGLGHTRGQCGYLRTSRRRVFPFHPSFGTWTLQLDTRRGYSRQPGGPVARIRVLIS